MYSNLQCMASASTQKFVAILKVNKLAALLVLLWAYCQRLQLKNQVASVITVNYVVQGQKF